MWKWRKRFSWWIRRGARASHSVLLVDDYIHLAGCKLNYGTFCGRSLFNIAALFLRRTVTTWRLNIQRLVIAISLTRAWLHCSTPIVMANYYVLFYYLPNYCYCCTESYSLSNRLHYVIRYDVCNYGYQFSKIVRQNRVYIINAYLIFISRRSLLWIRISVQIICYCIVMRLILCSI